MNCPKCNDLKSDVIDSRDSGQMIRRRRKCRECGERWTTYEMSAEYFDSISREPAREQRVSEQMRPLVAKMERILREVKRERRFKLGPDNSLATPTDS